MEEVALGYTAEEARREASRCLQCATKPCMQGCPVAIDIPGFLAKAADGDFAGALEVIRKTSLLPAVCGRVCPQEKQCQMHCTVGKILKGVDKAVAIGRVERFCADLARTNGDASGDEALCAPPTGKKVAVIGSGPASITAAAAWEESSSTEFLNSGFQSQSARRKSTGSGNSASRLRRTTSLAAPAS